MLDIQGKASTINEIGVASVHVSNGKLLDVSDDDTLRTFYHQNDVQAHTLRVRGGMKIRHCGGGIKFGERNLLNREELIEELDKWSFCNEHLGSYPLALVSYGLYFEIDWISRACPSFLARFARWVDVQEIVKEC